MSLQDSSMPNMHIVLSGNSAVGKTALLKYFPEGPGIDLQSVSTTIIAQYKDKVILAGSRSVHLYIWHISGNSEERFRTLVLMYLRSALGFLFVYDTSKPWPAYEMQRWANLIKAGAPEAAKMIVGIQVDKGLESVVIESKQFADGIDALHKVASASTGEGVQEVFDALVNEILSRNPLPGEPVVGGAPI